MKTIFRTIICILIFSFLFSTVVTAKDSNTSKDNSTDVFAQQLKEKGAKKVIKTYVATHEHLIEFANGSTAEDLMKNDKYVRYLTLNKSNIFYKELSLHWVNDNGILETGTSKRIVSNNFKWIANFYEVQGYVSEETMYNFVKDKINVKNIEISDNEKQAVTNIYFFFSPTYFEKNSVVAYQTADSMYFAFYNNGNEEEPVYMSQESFYEYARQYAEGKAKYDSEQKELTAGGTFVLDAAPFANRNVKIIKPINIQTVIWVSVAVVCVIAVAVIAVLLVRKRRKRLDEYEFYPYG